MMEKASPHVDTPSPGAGNFGGETSLAGNSWLVQHWKGLSVEFMESPSLEGFKKCLEVALGDVVW